MIRGILKDFRYKEMNVVRENNSDVIERLRNFELCTDTPQYLLRSAKGGLRDDICRH